ncbi:lipid II flippase MurJ [Vibrio breoganii]|uniref:lipid II flippase MurJ n=1 Tax=Vibrio breoganii TaxID=553239 RepID=UPI001F0AC572|nr:lipid II flippase MurJ [Vibrio breoganii]
MKEPIILALLSSVNIVSVFVLQIVAFNIIGVSNETDALFLGLSIPTIILSITVTSLNNVLVPMLSGIGRAETKVIVSSMIVVLCGGAIAVTILLALTIDFWIPVLAHGFDYETLLLAKKLTLVQLTSIPFSILYSIQWSLLNAKKKHIRAEAVPAMTSFIMFPIIVFAIFEIGIWGLAVAMPARVAIQSLVLLPYTQAISIKGFDLATVRIVLRRLKPLMLGSAYYKSEPVIDRSLLTSSNDGVLSMFYFSQQIYAALGQILTKAIVTPSIAKMAHHYHNQENLEFANVYRFTYKKLLLICFAMSLLLIFIGKPILELVINFRGQSPEVVSENYFILLLLFGSFIGNLIGSLASGAFYAIGNTKLPSYVSMFTYTVYIPAKILVYLWYGVYGLAITVSLYSLLNVLIITFIFIKRFVQRGQ